MFVDYFYLWPICVIFKFWLNNINTNSIKNNIISGGIISMINNLFYEFCNEIVCSVKLKNNCSEWVKEGMSEWMNEGMSNKLISFYSLVIELVIYIYFIYLLLINKPI